MRLFIGTIKKNRYPRLIWSIYAHFRELNYCLEVAFFSPLAISGCWGDLLSLRHWALSILVGCMSPSYLSWMSPAPWMSLIPWIKNRFIALSRLTCSCWIVELNSSDTYLVNSIMVKHYIKCYSLERREKMTHKICCDFIFLPFWQN